MILAETLELSNTELFLQKVVGPPADICALAAGQSEVTVNFATMPMEACGIHL